MSTINDGGPVFPCLERGGNGLDLTHAGMTLRDYMAINASEEDIRYQGEVIRSAKVRRGMGGILPDGWHITARYMHADAMLTAREKGGA